MKIKIVQHVPTKPSPEVGKVYEVTKINERSNRQRAHIDGFVSVIDAMTVRQKYHEEVGELLKNAA